MSSPFSQSNEGDAKKEEVGAEGQESPLALEREGEREEEEKAHGEKKKKDEKVKEADQNKEEEMKKAGEEKRAEDEKKEEEATAKEGSVVKEGELPKESAVDTGDSKKDASSSDATTGVVEETKTLGTGNASSTPPSTSEAKAADASPQESLKTSKSANSDEAVSEASEEKADKDKRKTDVEGRFMHARAKSCTLNRASSKQQFFPMDAWFQIYPLLSEEDLGPGFSSDMFVNSSGLKIATYAWRQRAKPKGAAVLFHSYTSYALFDFLRHQPENGLTGKEEEDASWMPKFKDSFVELFVKMGMNVYALDHQGHGRSDGWREWRCNVPKFDYLIDDAIQFLKEKVEADPALPRDAPLVVVGYSMGGNVVIQCLERILRVDDLSELKRRVHNAVLLAPLIKIKLDRKTELLAKVNRCCVASCLPNLRFSRESSCDCKYLDAWYGNDPLAYSGRTKSRMVASLYEASLKTSKILGSFPPDLKLLCLQGTADGTVDFRAPLKLYESKVKLDMFYLCGWSHYLPKDRRVDKLLGVVGAWVEKAVFENAEASQVAHLRALSLLPPQNEPVASQDA